MPRSERTLLLRADLSRRGSGVNRLTDRSVDREVDVHAGDARELGDVDPLARRFGAAVEHRLWEGPAWAVGAGVGRRIPLQ
jgi:hypothetical protein